jgi:putative redox protein
MIIDCQSEQPNGYPQTIQVRSHQLRADIIDPLGGNDTAPGPHDYFDSALASCKALTALWYAKHNGIPLERVESHVESDNSEERKGIYKLRVRLRFHGPLSDEQKQRLYNAASRCPIHKLMTTSEVLIEVAPLE